jgi:hypothetical protein
MSEEIKKNGLNWPTVVLILATGAGNLLTTQHGNVSLGAEQQEALRKIRELHQSLDEFEDRSRESLKGIRQSLTNQNTIMANDSTLLKEIHDIAKQIEQNKTSPR